MKELMTIGSLSIFLVLQTSFLLAETLSGRVVSIGDGDTLRIKVGDETLTTRLSCIDSPETDQTPHGARATERLKQLLPPGSTVKLEVVDRDRYGRTVALVSAGGKSINLEMVATGNAAVYSRYLNNCPSLKARLLAAEANAKSKKLGIWSENNPVMPWNWRAARRDGTTGRPRNESGARRSSDNGLPACVNSDCDCYLLQNNYLNPLLSLSEFR